MSSRLGDGLWEAKFILPEHMEAMKVKARERKRKTRPMLDDQEQEQILRALSESLREHKRIKLRIFGEYKDVEVSGIVTAVQRYRQEIRLDTAPDEWEWIEIIDVLAAE
ncbi:YolD-like protein [compost metagenome]